MDEKRNLYGTSMPLQKLPLKRKNEEWKKANIDYWIGKAEISNTNEEEIKKLYDLYNSKFDEKDLEYVTDPFKVDEGFPATPQNFNIIKPKIDLLLGEEIKKPDKFKVIQSSSAGASKAEEALKNLLFRNVLAKVKGNQQDQMSLDQIQDYIEHDFTDVAEKSAYYTLEYLKSKLNIKNELVRGLKDALISDKEIYYTGIVNGNPTLERVNPIGFYHDTSPDLDGIEYGDWAVRHMKMFPASIYDRFYDKLKEKKYLDRLLEIAGGEPVGSKPSDVNYDKILYRENLSTDLKDKVNTSVELIDVYHVVWKSYKKIGFLSYIDPETGEEIEETVDETYKFDEEDEQLGAEINWEWVTEVWEGYKIGSDIYIGIEPIPNQHFSIEDPSGNKLPYIGSVYNDDNSESTSLVALMRPLQFMYIVIFYRLELTLARDKGRIFTIDITQIPKSQGIDVQKWLHYLTSMGVNFINPYEEGWDIPGREGGQPAQFNQMSAQDLTMSNVIAEYVQLLDKIEMMVGELSGVSKQRQGAIAQQELVGNVERSVVQSSHITEPIYWKHNQVKKRVYESLLDSAKIAWSDSENKYLHFVFDDMSRAFINLTDDFTYGDFDVFVSDSNEENRKVQVLHGLTESAIQQGASLYEVSEALSSNNVTDIKKKLEKLEEKKQQLQQQMQQQEQQSRLQEKQMESEQKQLELDFKREDSIRKSSTDIEVALINSEAKQSSDTLLKQESELEQLRLKQEEARQKAEKLDEEKRQNRAQEEIKQKELSLKEQQLENRNNKQQ